MSKIASALGKKYEENRLSVLTRTFELGGHTFKVRVPNVSEIEAIYNYANNPNQDEIEKIYQDYLANRKDNEDETVEIKENDIIVNGNSMREAAKLKHLMRYRIVEYIKFLIPEIPNGFDGLTYEDVNEEFPLSIQINIIDKINEVISPDYKEIKSK